jgi:hypothetical protein
MGDMAPVIRLGLAGLALVAVVIVASCSPTPATHEPYVATLAGTSTSPWIAVPTGWSDLSSKQSPGGCAQRLVVTNANEQTVAMLAPVFITDDLSGHEAADAAAASTRWSGYSAHLAAGVYRFEGTASKSCHWSVHAVFTGKTGYPFP